MERYSADVPARLRAALVAQAARALAEYEPAAVPTPLVRVYRFAPAKRASAGAAPLWAALVEDNVFRARVRRSWAAANDALAARWDAPDDPGADEGAETQPSLDAAVGAWLSGREGWRELLPDQPSAPADSGEVTRLRAEAERLRDLLARAQQDAREAQEALAAAQRDARKLRSDADRARAQGRQAVEEAALLLAQAHEARDAAQAARTQAAEARSVAESQRTAARAELRVARKLADARVRLLLDTIVDAASGLRSELALAPMGESPADLVAPEQPAPTPARTGSRGRAVDDPALLDELLRQPHAHLIVDGYNVSKTGYGELTLELQRQRLVDGLATLAARTGAEVTCCFDGQETTRPPGGYARGVRVRFSVGEIADELIRRLVQAEPVGRVLVVVTSDQAVARDVERRGAFVVPSATLVARLRQA